MDSDYDPSEDSLNVHDLSALDVAVSSDSDDSLTETPKQLNVPRNAEPGTETKNSDLAKTLSVLQCNISRSLSLSDKNNESVSSGTSLQLLSDEKLSFNDDNILGLTNNILNANNDSPNSDKENTVARVSADRNVFDRNDTMSLLAGGGDYIFNTPIVNKSLSNVTPASAGSLKKVSFSEKVLQSSYQSLDSHNSDETAIQNSVLGLPDANMGLVFGNDMYLTRDSSFTDISPRKSSESTLKTDSNTSNVLAQLQQLAVELPANLTTDPSEPFSLSSDGASKNSSPVNRNPFGVSEDCNNNDNQAACFNSEVNKSTTTSHKSDSFYKSFTVSNDRSLNTPAKDALANESFRSAAAAILKDDPFTRTLNQTDFTNTNVEQDASLGEKIFKDSFSDKLRNLNSTDVTGDHVVVGLSKENQFVPNCTEQVVPSIETAPRSPTLADHGPVDAEVNAESKALDETHNSSHTDLDDVESLAEISASCESFMTDCTLSEDDSTHVISLETIKATWPTLNSLMKAKEIANRFESLCSNPAPDYDACLVPTRSKIPQPPSMPLASDGIPSNRDSLGVSRFEELLEYPLSDKSLSKPLSAHFNVSTDQQPLIDLNTSSFANLSCIPSNRESKPKESRGLSFSTPKSKNGSSLESTSALLSGETKIDKFNETLPHAGENATLVCLPSKYLNKSQIGDNESVFMNDSLGTLATVVYSNEILSDNDVNDKSPKSCELPLKLTCPALDDHQKIDASFALKSDDVALDTQVLFPNTILGFTSTKELGIENNSDKWIVAVFSISKCRLSDNELGPKVVVDDVFRVKNTLIMGPRSKKVYEIAFTPSKPGSYTAWVSVCLKGSVDNAKIEKIVQVEATCEQHVATFLRDSKPLKMLEFNVDSDAQKLADEANKVDVLVEWNCSVPVRLNCCLFASEPESLVFVAVDDETVRESGKVSFFAKEVDENGMKFCNKLTLACKTNIASTLASCITGKLELYVVNAEKRLLVASLPIEVAINRQHLRVPEEVAENLILKCDNNYSPILFPVINLTNEQLSVEIECDKSIINVSPALFSLAAGFEQKVKIKVIHGNIPQKESGGIYFETPITLFSAGVKQSVLNVKLEHPKFVNKRCLTFGAKALLFRSPEIFSPIVENLKIKNTTNETIAFSVYIENVACFEISAIDRQNKKPGVHDVELKPGALCKVALKFHSYDVKMEVSYLTVRVKSSFLKYVIPLYGYSGHSQLQACIVPNETNNDSNFSEILLTNKGIQDLCFVINPESIGNLSVSPTFGVIKSREKKILKVLMDNRSLQSEDLEVNWGDALLKQLYDCCSKSDWEAIPSPISRLMTTDYGSELEDSCNFGRSVTLSNRFLNFVNNTLFVSVGSNPDDIHDELPESERSERESSMGTVVEEDPDLQTRFPNQIITNRSRRNSSQREKFGWIVRPNSLSFPSEQQSFIVENTKAEALDFCVLTPDTVLAKPTRGTLGPKEEVIVEVRCTEKQNSRKPFHDTLCVKIGSDIQEIKLRFNQEQETTANSSPLRGSVVSLNISESFNTLVNEILKFPTAKVGDSLQTTLSFSNNLPDRIKWVLSSVAPAFVKWPDKRMFKANYAVFRVEKCLGYLNAKENTELKVDFVPMDIGVYFQHWELQIVSLGANNDSKFIRICLNGEAKRIRKSLSSSRDVEDFDTELPSVDLLQPIEDEKANKRRKLIYVSRSKMDFPDVKMGWSLVRL